MAAAERKTASLILPILNEERYIENCVRSLLEQDYPREELEILLVDGMSSDGTMEILRRLESEFPNTVRVLENPKRIQASAMNVGADAACGEYLLRIDAHVEYPLCYVSTCIRLIEETGASNTGCACRTEARTKTGKIIAKLLTSSFAVGGSRFRVGAESGYVDTVPFGTFRKSYYQELGGFDERLARSEDNEINYRIRKRGGKIYMTSDIQVTYYCRETVGALAKQAAANGKWTILSARLCPGSMSLKYFVPFLFDLSLIAMPPLSFLHPLFAFAFAAELALYLTLALLSAARKANGLRELLFLTALFPIFHIAYGLGSFAGLGALFIPGKWTAHEQPAGKDKL
ncbi:MAG: glycosyltransferase family 2 protein [Oscillibacter sp.]|nr:glycosyltransferase family 2 protein [Oscillibacter sp.]